MKKQKNIVPQLMVSAKDYNRMVKESYSWTIASVKSMKEILAPGVEFVATGRSPIHFRVERAEVYLNLLSLAWVNAALLNNGVKPDNIEVFAEDFAKTCSEEQNHGFAVLYRTKVQEHLNTAVIDDTDDPIDYAARTIDFLYNHKEDDGFTGFFPKAGRDISASLKVPKDCVDREFFIDILPSILSGNWFIVLLKLDYEIVGAAICAYRSEKTEDYDVYGAVIDDRFMTYDAFRTLSSAIVNSMGVRLHSATHIPSTLRAYLEKLTDTTLY